MEGKKKTHPHKTPDKCQLNRLHSDNILILHFSFLLVFR